ncbi:MAG: hypothetical protein K6A65_01970 [Succinivibrionaceae bacterium]|nr:hypothetical protein [Succinivibrionaceae bacterium]
MDATKFVTYPVNVIAEDDGGCIIKVRGWEGALSEADSMEEMPAMAQSLILDLAEGYIQARKPVPEAEPLRDGDIPISIPYDAAVKIAMRNAMLEEGIRPKELAGRLGQTPQALAQALGLRRATKLSTIAGILAAFGRSLQVSF